MSIDGAKAMAGRLTHRMLFPRGASVDPDDDPFVEEAFAAPGSSEDGDPALPASAEDFDFAPPSVPQGAVAGGQARPAAAPPSRAVAQLRRIAALAAQGRPPMPVLDDDLDAEPAGLIDDDDPLPEDQA